MELFNGSDMDDEIRTELLSVPNQLTVPMMRTIIILCKVNFMACGFQ